MADAAGDGAAAADEGLGTAEGGGDEQEQPRGQLSLIQREGHEKAASYLEESVKSLGGSASEFTNIENLNQKICDITESVDRNEELVVDMSSVMDAMTDYLRLYLPGIIGHEPKQSINPSTYHDFVLSLPEGTNDFRCLMCQEVFVTSPTKIVKSHFRQCTNLTKNVTDMVQNLMLSLSLGLPGKRKRASSVGQSYSLGGHSGHQNKDIGGLVDAAVKLLSDLASEYHRLERNPSQFGKTRLELEEVLASIRAKALSSEQPIDQGGLHCSGRAQLQNNQAGQSSLLGGACFQPGAQVLQQGASNYYGFQGSLPTGVPSLPPNLLQQQVHNYETGQQQHVFMQQQQQQWILQQQQNQQFLQQQQNQQFLQQQQQQNQQFLQQQQNQQFLQQQQNQQFLHNQGAPLSPLGPISPSFEMEDFLQLNAYEYPMETDEHVLLQVPGPGLHHQQYQDSLPQQPPVLQELAVPAPPQPPVLQQQQNPLQPHVLPPQQNPLQPPVVPLQQNPPQPPVLPQQQNLS